MKRRTGAYISHIIYTVVVSKNKATLALSVFKARYQLEATAEIGIFQRLVLPLNRRIEVFE